MASVRSALPACASVAFDRLADRHVPAPCGLAGLPLGPSQALSQALSQARPQGQPQGQPQGLGLDAAESPARGLLARPDARAKEASPSATLSASVLAQHEVVEALLLGHAKRSAGDALLPHLISNLRRLVAAAQGTQGGTQQGGPQGPDARAWQDGLRLWRVANGLLALDGDASKVAFFRRVDA